MKNQKNIIWLCAVLTIACSACSSTGDDIASDANTISEEIQTTEEEGNTDNGLHFSETIGVWVYNQDIVYHAQNGSRYLLTENTAGSVTSSEGVTYEIQACDYVLYSIISCDGETLMVKEGRYKEELVGSMDYPDGYKRMMISYKKSDLFDLDALEQAIASSNIEESASTVSATETDMTTESETTVITEKETQSDTTASENIETESDTTANASESQLQQENSEILENDENAEYAAIYEDIADFLATDNFIQKDNDNRALELFNHLHNLSNASIQESSILNDTANHEVSFTCFDKYLFVIDVENSTITVTES